MRKKNCRCSEDTSVEILKINLLEITGGGLMWIKAKKGYNGVEVEYDSKSYIFYEDKPTEAPKGILRHKFLEETAKLDDLEKVNSLEKFNNLEKNKFERKGKEVTNADIL